MLLKVKARPHPSQGPAGLSDLSTAVPHTSPLPLDPILSAAATLTSQLLLWKPSLLPSQSFCTSCSPYLEGPPPSLCIPLSSSAKTAKLHVSPLHALRWVSIPFPLHHHLTFYLLISPFTCLSPPPHPPQEQRIYISLFSATIPGPRTEQVFNTYLLNRWEKVLSELPAMALPFLVT